MNPSNCYEDAARAAAYAKLEFPGTYWLAYRDLPEIIARHVRGTRALDFGCGAGRSTRFLRRLGLETVGVDVSAAMIASARRLDPEGAYTLVREGDLGGFPAGAFDLVTAIFTFDNVPTSQRKVAILAGLGTMLGADGRIVTVVSSPEIYRHEWASFTTRDYPENARAKSGDTVRIVVTDLEDRRPVEDILWTEEAYRAVFEQAGLEPAETCRPLGREGEPPRWVNETTIAPWVVYVLRRASRS